MALELAAGGERPVVPLPMQAAFPM